MHSGLDSGINLIGKVDETINALLQLILFIVIIVTIIYFARFRLTTRIFQLQSFSIVAIRVVATVLSFARGANGDLRSGGDIMGGILCAIRLLSSVALMGYAISIRRAFLKFHKMETKCSTWSCLSVVDQETKV